MPDEIIITEIENILSQVIELGAASERTRVAPNLLVTNGSPAGLSDYIIVRDDRDGDNILALKIPGVIYNTNDLVNVMFIQGSEAIAFQQGSGSSTSGLWEIVAATSTDIYYNSGDVGIGKAVAPDARLELLDTAQAQLRLTFQEDTKFTELTADTNHDFTIDPSSTGQIILASDDVTIGEDLIHSGDTDTKLTFTTDDVEFTVGGLSMLKLTEAVQDAITIGAGSGDIDVDFNGDMFLEGSSGNLNIGSNTDLGFGGFVQVQSNGNTKIPLIIREKSGNSVYLTQWENTAGTELASVRDSGIFFTSTSSATTGSGIGGTSFRTQNRDSTVGNRSGMICVNSNGDPCGAYQVEFQSHAAGTGDLRMGIFSASSYVEVMRVTSGQRVSISSGSSPVAKLDVNQTGSAAGIEVLGLHQADVDEPFISVDGTAASADLTRSLIDEGDVSTATRIGWLMVYVNDDGNQIADGNYWVPFYSLA